jgi:GT2 family glycosyltransferase
MEASLYFSLITSTIKRTFELIDFINSLKEQSFKDFELILVDQNSDDRLKNIVNEFSGQINLKYTRSEKGVSKGRNKGLEISSGEIIAFPDDDCEYPPDILMNIHNFFITNSTWHYLSVMIVDKSNKNPVGIKWRKTPSEINNWNFFNTFCSASLFIRAEDVNDIKFDEKLGAGSMFGSSEETDLVYRLFLKGYIGYYNPEFKVFHPLYNNSDRQGHLKRLYTYSLGYGAFFKKHLFRNFRVKFFLNFIRFIVLGSIFGIIIRILYPEKLKEKYVSIKGITEGFLKYSV